MLTKHNLEINKLITPKLVQAKNFILKHKSKTSTDVVIATITGILILISVIYSTKLFAHNLGPYEFGLYSISRRFIANIFIFYSAGLAIGTTRYLALNKHCKNTQKSFVFVSSLFTMATALLTIGLFNITSEFSSNLLLGSAKFTKLLLSSNYLLLSFAFSSLIVSIYRGYNYILRANIVQLVSFAVIPIVIGLFFSKNHSSIYAIKMIGLFTLGFIVIPFANEFIKSIKPAIKVGLKVNIDNLKELLKYSVPRLPANLAMAGLFTIGPYIVIKMGNVESAGYLTAAQNVLRMADMSAFGVGFVLLPKLSEYAGKNQTKKITDITKLLLSIVSCLGIYLSLHLALLADNITLAWLGKAYYNAIPLMRITLLSIGFYLAYVSLRCVVDAVEFKPINTMNTIISLVLALGTALLVLFTGSSVIYMAVAAAVGFSSLGILTLVYLHKKYNISVKIYKLGYLIPVNMVLLLFSYFIKKLFSDSLILYLVGEVIILLLYVLILKFLKIIFLPNTKELENS